MAFHAEHAQRMRAAEGQLEELRRLNASTRGSVQVLQGTQQSIGEGLEQEVARALAAHLVSGRVVRAGYKWRDKRGGGPGDVGCVVSGELDGRCVG